MGLSQDWVGALSRDAIEGLSQEQVELTEVLYSNTKIDKIITGVRE